MHQQRTAHRLTLPSDLHRADGYMDEPDVAEALELCIEKEVPVAHGEISYFLSR